MKSVVRSGLFVLLTSVILSGSSITGATITVTPASPTLLIGDTLQLSTNGAVVPVQISAGNWHTCVRFSDQSVRCAGLNSQGQLGDGTFTRSAMPVLASPLANPVAIRVGAEHSCAQIGDGSLQCWGTNFTGQLGDGTMGGFAVRPQPVHNITNATKLLTGGFFTCAMLSDNTVQCWGRNQDGQLGNGDSTTDVPLPAPVPGLGPVADFSAGGYHACALLFDSTATCWGRNSRGQVGNGNDQTPVTSPTPVVGLSNAAVLEVGGYHTCAILQNRDLLCWGENQFGQIGSTTLAFSAVPRAVPGMTGVASVSAGFYHTCAILTDGSLWCWGKNDFGELGDGSTVQSGTPLRVPGILNPVSVVAGGFHTCVLLNDASVRCWGENDFGELGNGTMVHAPAPTKMLGTGLTWTSSDSSIATVSATGLVTAQARGTATISVTDGVGNTGSATVTVKGMMSLVVSRQGDGGGVAASNPAGISCGTACDASFVEGTAVTLTATPNATSNFAGWTGCDSVAGTSCGVSMAQSRSVSAIFMLKRFTLTVAKGGIGSGTVTSSPAGINCGSQCGSDYVTGTVVTLTASPALGNLFTGWSGCDSVNGATCIVTVSAARTATASFLGLPLFP